MTKIEWTDVTWNPVRGCTKISPGCKHCYAETFAERWREIPGHPYEQGFDLRLVPEKLAEPLKWRKPRRVFVNSMSDLFHEDVPNEYIAAVFGVMAACADREMGHTFQLLTKRSSRMRLWFEDILRHHSVASYLHEAVKFQMGYHNPQRPAVNLHFGWPLPNVWLGVSCEDETRLDRVNDLRETPAAIRFLSLEPLLGPLPSLNLTGISWVIVGGESGPGARPCNVGWIRDIARQCGAAAVPCFVKQLGKHPIETNPHLDDAGWPGGAARHIPTGIMIELGPKASDPERWPADLRVRQFPEVTR